MENIKEYKIRIGATAKYMQSGNNRDTEKFIASMEGKKIWYHWFAEDADDFSEVWVSQYEKTGQFKIPVELLEEYIEEIELEEVQNNFNYKEYIKQNKNIVIACFLLVLLVLFFSVNWNFLKANTLEVKQEKTIFQTLDDRDIMLSQKESLELQEQKELREKISDSKKRVEEIRKQKIEIAKQKLELAQ